MCNISDTTWLFSVISTKTEPTALARKTQGFETGPSLRMKNKTCLSLRMRN